VNGLSDRKRPVTLREPICIGAGQRIVRGHRVSETTEGRAKSQSRVSRTVTRAGYCAKNAVAEGILSSGRRSWSMPWRSWSSAARRPSNAGVRIGESNRGGGAAVATTNPVRYEEARCYCC
jgi:hypothetical protein